MMATDGIFITWIATILVLLFGANSSAAYEIVHIDTASQLIEHFGEKLQILDVRTPEEYALGHIPHAHNLNIGNQSFKQQILALNPDMPILVYCRSGVRAESAASILASAGFTEIYLMKAEFSSWMKSHPVA